MKETNSDENEIVKKKRGRKKKWENSNNNVLINSSISFDNSSDVQTNNNNIQSSNNNEDSEKVSFGNLNIFVSSNKEIIDTKKIKNDLKKSKNNQIELTDTSQSNNKLGIMNVIKNQKKLKVLKHYKDSIDSGIEICKTDIRCYYCHHSFSNKPFFLPIEYDSKLNRYKVTGNFCSPNCVKSYSINSPKNYLVGEMYRKLYNKSFIIKPAPPIQVLKCYGGNLSIDEFRNNFNNDVYYELKSINCKIELDEFSTSCKNKMKIF